MYAGRAKTPSNRIATTRVPAKTLQNVNSQCDRRIQEDFRLTFLKIILCYFAVKRWLSGPHLSGKALMLRKIPDTFLNQHSPHKVEGVTEE